MQNNSANRAFRVELQKLLCEMGQLYHFYETRLSNERVDLPQAMRDLAAERATVEGRMATLMITQGRTDDEATDSEATGEDESGDEADGRVTTRVAVTAYESAPERATVSMSTVVTRHAPMPGSVIRGMRADGSTYTERVPGSRRDLEARIDGILDGVEGRGRSTMVP